MRVAVLADIHGNLPACEAVLEDIERAKPDFIVAAGDLALRGAHPKETLQLLDDKCDALIMGNTDCYLSGQYLGGAYRDRDHWKTDLLHWTRDQIGEEWVRRLGQLDFSARYSPRRGQDLYVCHANPKNLEDSLEPTLDESILKKYLAHVDATAVAFGHLHFPYRRRVGKILIADVASAGIPRDGDHRPAWGLFTYTPKGWRVQIRRVRYQVRKATQAISLKRMPGAPLLIHKMVEARYRNHAAMQEAARRHSGLPPLRPTGPSFGNQPVLRPPHGYRGPPPPSLVEALTAAAAHVNAAATLLGADPVVPSSGELSALEQTPPFTEGGLESLEEHDFDPGPEESEDEATEIDGAKLAREG